jgi:archaellum component FlaC
MYRAPGREQHQEIAEILDEIMNRLTAIENTLTTLEETK